MLARAVRVVPPSEAREHLNLWVLALNLDKQFGTPAQLAATFQRGLESVAPHVLHGELAKLHLRHGELDAAQAVYETMVRRFRAQVGAAWVPYLRFLLRHRRDFDAAHAVLQRCLAPMVAGKAREFARMRFAQECYRAKMPQQGRIIVESILAASPQRAEIRARWVQWERQVLVLLLRTLLRTLVPRGDRGDPRRP